MKAGIELEYWTGSKFDSKGNYGSGRRSINLEAVDPQTVADVLRALARDVERAAGLRARVEELALRPQ